MTNILEVRSLSKRYHQGKRLLDQLDIELAPGQRASLIGASGSGKSTLLHLIAGLEAADEGSILIGGKPMNAHDAQQSARLRAQSIGFIFQAFHLLPHLNALQNVAVPALLLGSSEKSAMSRALDLLDQLGLSDRAHARPSELSGGEQQRVAIARAVIHAPRLILADEPTGNLDPESADAVMTLLQQVLAQSDCALLFVTHDLQRARLFDPCWKLSQGKLQPA
ncbi:MAG: ABC transporter ATP-binding protein [Betaproteobacteria bacterium]|jgi:ABC-type lipoprotein export system ATPase subunit|nr:ABC transporter ATP-binding protein [Betaproteobacteria bacterium]NBQ77170.1 ABC transporter ATP-binding protein [Betaproteobacteria bacterium]NBS38902.1 ABC transporter ATP-binding protein [Betaproteobacteria bacterium]